MWLVGGSAGVGVSPAADISIIPAAGLLWGPGDSKECPTRLNYNLLLNIAHWLVDLSHNAANTALHWVDICMYLPAFQNFPCLYTVTSNEKVLAVRYIKDLFTACDIQILICVYCVCPTFGWVVNIIQMSWVQHLIEPEGLKWSSKCSPYCLLLWIDNHSIDV